MKLSDFVVFDPDEDPPARKSLKLTKKKTRAVKTTDKERVMKKAKRNSGSKKHHTPNSLSLVPRLGFLDLPAEIRNEIYAYALPSNKDNNMKASRCAVYPRQVNHCYFGHKKRNAPQTPFISEVSSQIKTETLSMFYARNDFHVHCGPRMDLSQAATWLMRLGPAMAPFIRRIHVVCAPLQWQHIAKTTPFLDAVRVLGLQRSQIVPSPHVGFKGDALHAFREFFDLAHKAQDEGWTEQGLEDEIARWIDTRMPMGRRDRGRMQSRLLEEGPAEVSEARKSGKCGLRARAAVKYSA